MPSDGGSQDVFDRIFALRTVAVVGCSPKPERPSHYVAAFLKEHGFRVIPVNPGHRDILGQRCYPKLGDIPEPVDVVDVFRRGEFVLPVIQEAIAIKAKALWLQDGITHPEGEALARQAGLLVVSNDCMLRRYYQRLGGKETGEALQ
ncbi:MAG TPA: CoA-binding protein [Elusimicrobia bacterium]|nr:MAG: CoA-binding protein [Elusimicrobia bacterium GWA2_66_18]OGR75278.1 MAG: CoA-binding protein [Elusimicrobia bacterium GWC2_65_9]HAZ07810.1 CoA-binding protein [Elusimicrobiota bacterium]